MQSQILDVSGNEVEASITDDPMIGEVIRSEDGEIYEIREINASKIVVQRVEVEEDWGQ